MRILFLTIDLMSNATGRTYALWLLAKSAGWDTEVIAPSGTGVWAPIATTEFAAECQVIEDGPGDEHLRLAATRADLIIAVKPLPGSYDRALRLERETGTPVLLDIDDPSIEARVPVNSPARLLARAILRRNDFWPILALRRAAKAAPHVIVSNPVLQQRWGGRVIPHARQDSGAGVEHGRTAPEIVFVGTNHPHKGIDVLREAVTLCQDVGATLTVTDEAPVDARPWERWVGRTTFEAGVDLVRQGDVVVLPSIPGRAFADAQLPAKIIDAMIAGRGIIVTDLPPLVWALGGAGLISSPHTPESFAVAIRQMADADFRRSKGEAARQRALASFTVQAVTPDFITACVKAAESVST